MDDTNVDKVDVDKIIQQIRIQVLQEKQSQRGSVLNLNLYGTAKTQAFYQALSQAWLLHNAMKIQPTIQPSSIPVVGNLITTMRRLVHNVVIFYVPQLLVQQKASNEQILVALSELSRDNTPTYESNSTD